MTISLISTQTLGSDVTSVTFSSIPQTATDLICLITARNTYTGVSAAGLIYTYNGVGTGYTSRSLAGDGSTAGSGSGTAQYAGTLVNDTWTANSFSSINVYIPNYAGSTAKSSSTEGTTERNATNSFTHLMANHSTATTAISSITFTAELNNIKAGSTFSLYSVTKGVKAGVTVS